MKYVNSMFVVIVLTAALSSCVAGGSTMSPISTETQLPSPTSILLTSTSTPSPLQTATLTPPATLKPEEAKDAIKTLLQEPTVCVIPCFWEIIPGKTTLDEAQKIFGKLGLNLEFTIAEGSKEFYGVIYDFDNGLRITPVLTIQDKIVKNLSVSISPETQEAGVPREWLSFSPETLVNQYGSPSKVDFFVGRAAPTPLHSMVMYFNTVGLVIEYHGADIITDMATLQVCPLVNQVDSVRIWIGDNPEHPPLKGVPLEDATSLTMEEFSKLMTGTSGNVCFNLKGEAFP